MVMRSTVACLIAATTLCAPLRADVPGQTGPDAAKKQAIRTLLDVTGSAKLVSSSIDAMIRNLPKGDNGPPPEFWVLFRKKLNPDRFVEALIPIYDKYFTREDIDAMISFYRTPVGKKMASVQPKLMQESMAVGEEMGRKAGEEAARELGAQGAPKP
jgi:hypothetical protein